MRRQKMKKDDNFWKIILSITLMLVVVALFFYVYINVEAIKADSSWCEEHHHCYCPQNTNITYDFDYHIEKQMLETSPPPS